MLADTLCEGETFGNGQVAYAISNLNALRGIFKDISEQAKEIVDKAEVVK